MSNFIKAISSATINALAVAAAGWTKLTSTVNLTSSSDRVGIGVANDGTYKVDILAADVNALRVKTAGSTNVWLEAATNAAVVINAGTGGGGTALACLQLLANGTEAGHLCSDQSDANKLKLDYGSSTGSTTGIVIDSSHRTGVGATPVASAKLAVTSTTEGLLPPRMTTAQKNAISSPAEGLTVIDLDLHKMCIYLNGGWETVVSA